MSENIYDFKKFAAALKASIDSLLKESELYRVDITGHDIWDSYLAAFPAGTNDIFRVRTYHDGSYDRNVLRQIGNLVAIKNGKLKSIFDIKGLEYPYDVVCAAIKDKVESGRISSIFRINQKTLGHEKSIEMIDGRAHTWHHFHAKITGKFFTNDVGKEVGEVDSRIGVFRRGLTELTVSALETVLSLIDDNLLYRGAEFKSRVSGFLATKKKYDTLSDIEKQIFVWTGRTDDFKNTVIGGLVNDLSKNVDLEKAVSDFERFVAPTNYKRTTKLITPTMIKDASKTIKELDLEDSLERRFAVIGDISVNNVLWVDPDAKQKMKGSAIDSLLAEVKAKPKYTEGQKAEEILIDDFHKILPNITSIEVLVKSSMKKNLMVLTAPVHDDSNNLFKWNNKIGWSYTGNITDSIKERVKTAGGNTNAILRVSLAWFNTDDLDIHCDGPDGHVYFGNKKGILDVDMNVGNPVRNAVENLSWTNPKNGSYTISVNNFTKRETSDVGFVLEVENKKNIKQFSYEKPVAGNKAYITFDIKDKVIENLKINMSDVKESGVSEDVWGIKTETFVPVETIMNSPNHWDENSVGNKHWFFILKDCSTTDPMRGIYNEFLKSELEKHRRVFEVLGDRTKCQPGKEQLAGVGFSETKGESVVVRVSGKKINKTFEILI